MKTAGTLIDALNAAPAERNFVTAWMDEDEHETVTFGEFRRRARVNAKVLMDHGVCVGDRIVILMPQDIAAMATFAGAMMLGAVPAILAYPNFKVEPSKYASGLAGVTANLSAKVVVIDEEFPDEFLEYIRLNDGAQLLRAGSAAGNGDVALPPCEVDSKNLAFIQHSAGTTGLQKGVALTHHAVLTQISHLSQALRVDGATDRIYSWLPLYHDMGLIACFMLPMACHVPVVMQSPLDWVMHPETMLQVISDFRCTMAWMPNFAFQFVPRQARPQRWQQWDLSSIRAFVNCSEPIRAASIREFQQAFNGIGLRPSALHSSYAMAENVFAVTQSDIMQPWGPHHIWADGPIFRTEHRISLVDQVTHGALAFVSSGKLFANHRVRVVSDEGKNLTNGSVGEILIDSDCLFEGYFNRPDLTSQVLRDGWYRTGDLGFVLDGELFVVGRKKDLLIVGGENLYPQDIEEIIAAHPAIHDGRTVAIGIYNPSLGTEDIVIVAEVETEELLKNTAQLEQELRSSVVAGLGIAVRCIYLKPPKWIVKSTAGKPARAGTRDKLLREHPELNAESEETAIV
jgi:acyl-CoA synthetase (AMP-forming)/AMP-acid ligase II